MAFNIREAIPKDTEIIFDLIKKLAIYEKMENEVVGSVKDLQENIFENMKLNKSEIVKRRVGEIRLFVVYKVVSQIHRTRLILVF